MKNFKFTGDQLTPNLRDKIADSDAGIYVVYGAFIEGTSLNLTRLYKGSFNDIVLKLDDPTNVDPDKVEYLLPVPEYIVDHTDAEYAKYLNIHLVPSSDIEDDETMLRKFCEAYTKKLSDAGLSPDQDSDSKDFDDTNNADAGTDNNSDFASLAQMEDNLKKLQKSSALLDVLQQKVGLKNVASSSENFIDSSEEKEQQIDYDNPISTITDVVAK